MAGSSAGRRGRLWLVGPLPPPVHGMALVNQHVFRCVRERGAEPTVFDTAPPDTRTSWWSRAARGTRAALALVRFAARAAVARPRTVYLSVSGGLGQAYEVAFALLARLFRVRLFLHHHSYRYLSARRPLTAWLVRAASRRATHVVLCEDQGQRLQALYRGVDRVRVVSNAALFRDLQAAGTHEGARTIGFFGSVSREKGIDDFLGVCERLASDRGAVRGVIAGPFAEAPVERDVRAFVARHAWVEYLGPLYGADKERFFERVDVLLFPSRTEAEPLTVFEAMAAGVPIIALDQGCLGGVLGAGAGSLVSQREAFVEHAVRQIRRWQERPDSYRKASEGARARCRAAAETARRALDQLVNDLAEPETGG